MDSNLIKLILIIIISVLPTLIYWLMFRKIKRRWQSRLRQTRLAIDYGSREESFDSFNNREETEYGQYYIGDLSCRFNARSPYIRCAINPHGPCRECSYYEAKK